METLIIIILVLVVAALIYQLACRSNQGNEHAVKVMTLEADNTRLCDEVSSLRHTIDSQTESIRTLTSERDVLSSRVETMTETFNAQQASLRQSHSDQISKMEEMHSDQIRQLQAAHEQQMADIRAAHQRQIQSLTETYQQQSQALTEAHQRQVRSLTDTHREQFAQQQQFIKEQLKATSEDVLRQRQEELGKQNNQQVSSIVGPIAQGLKDMMDALDKARSQQGDALARLDETIKAGMQQSAALGQTADRLTRALTGEVKVQGNFGELRLKKLLEDMELKEGEQFDTQETLRDSRGRAVKDESGRGLIPDFILHFPDNRHVVVDSKMSLTDYERYMNAPDGTSEKTDYLKAHIASVRSQVARLAKKDYVRYLPEGYNRLDFAIMYVPVEGALNLALLNDSTLWKEAYDMGVMILGPQTMFMNLRVLEVMWTQVRQLNNQQAMIDCANTIIDRVQDFGIRFMEVEKNMEDTVASMSRLKITTADKGASIITAARNLLKAGAKENKKKKALEVLDESE